MHISMNKEVLDEQYEYQKGLLDQRVMRILTDELTTHEVCKVSDSVVFTNGNNQFYVRLNDSGILSVNFWHRKNKIIWGWKWQVQFYILHKILVRYNFIELYNEIIEQDKLKIELEKTQSKINHAKELLKLMG